MARSKWKGPYFKNQKINTHKNLISRNTQILPNFVGKTYYVHNGKSIQKLIIIEEMLGYRLGEFFFTRKELIYSKK
jgi:small subunit ribosomal protein S19